MASELHYTITATTKAGIIEQILDQQEYTITYTLDGGTVATENPAKYTRKTAAFTLNNPTKSGYTFAGWTGTGLEGATETVTVAKGSTGARSYTATWVENYTISYDLDGGEVAEANPETYSSLSESFTLNNPTKEGYTFTGWTGTGLESATETVTVESGSTGNRSYTATWEAVVEEEQNP